MEEVFQNCPVTLIFIDGRFELEQLQIFATNRIKKLQQVALILFDDSHRRLYSCTLKKQSSHTAAMIASHMVGTFINHITNLYTRRILEVFFYYEFILPWH
jgi:hypothetical protein